MPERNVVTLFSEAELKAALSLTGTPESAAAVAAELYAVPNEEQIYLDWIDTTLLLLSCISDDLARRVLENFGNSPASRARLEADQRKYREWISSRGDRPRETIYELEDVVRDSRQDTSLMTGFRHDATNDQLGRNFIALFTERELRSALASCADAEAAAAVAAQVYALEPERQTELDWTDLALGLLAAGSADVAQRVVSLFGNTVQRREDIDELAGLLRELIDSGELAAQGMCMELDTVVRPRY